MAEFLPLCDLLFNIVSLAAYFCDVVFDLLMVYALYETGPTIIFAQCLCAIVVSSLVTQFVSINWHFKRKNRSTGITRNVIVAIHLLQLAMLWRYARLLAPVKLEYVKKEVRDLCVLRLIHAFLQAAPMLLLQLSLLPGGGAPGAATAPRSGPPADLVVVSAALSLFTVCWALASFSKHVQSVERLVLTWLGVVSQLLWRCGTVSSRAIALSAYAATYHSWIFLVLALHWSCMFLWLLSPPRNAFYGARGKRLSLCLLLAAVYVFTYINLQNKPHVRTMTVFYVVMLLENVLLVAAWLAAVWNVRPAQWVWVPLLTVGLFLLGLLFMVLYYRYFHVRRLLDTTAARKQIELNGTTLANNSTHHQHHHHHHNHLHHHHHLHHTAPGVFNCRFAAAPAASAAYRKKKKPTSFVLPPNLGVGVSVASVTAAPNTTYALSPSAAPPTVSVPFWRRPLPSSSENEGSSSVGSRINIHQKLQEKKQKQLAELKIIEEEIKQGKLVGPEAGDPSQHHRRNLVPIPRTKRHMEPQLISLASLNNLASYGVNLNRRPPPRAPTTRTRTPELLLAPRYLYYDCPVPEPEPVPAVSDMATSAAPATAAANSNHSNHSNHSNNSDMESQVSLPRSYTLPREFKYQRRVGRQGRRPLTAPVASTNSSDADVDSAGDDESDSCYNAPVPVVCPLRRPFRHETKL